MRVHGQLVRFHVELPNTHAPLPDLQLKVGVEAVPLIAHDERSRTDAARDNAVIRQMRRPERITHYADVPVELLPDHEARPLKVTYDLGDPAFYLRGLLLIADRIPPRGSPSASEKQEASPRRTGCAWQVEISGFRSGAPRGVARVAG